MKVGILTYHNTNNYGASLQAYALCRAINEMGYDCDIIDYQNAKMKNDLIKAYARTKDGLIEKIYYELRKKDILKRKEAFQNFKNKYMKLSAESCETKEELSIVGKKYDKIITGSDQVWNYNINDNDYSFFLDFCNTEQKVSYAASFGLSEIDGEHWEKVASCISDIPNLSLREVQGIDIVKKMVNRDDAVLVCDPTLLLDKSEWSLMQKKNKYGPYILIYCFGYSETLYSAAEKMSKETGYKIVVIDGTIKNKFIFGKDSATGIGPDEWVSLFLNAEYIFTNSFHGTAFSINFNKLFFTELLKEKNKLNSRLESILNYLSLNDRILVEGKSESFNKKIDYKSVNLKLVELKEESFKFLRSAIGENK